VLVPLVLVAIWTVYRTAELAQMRRNEATHDMLTQLPQPEAVRRAPSRAVLSARRTGQRVAVVLIDLDGFKAINDRLGHDVGDEVLRSVAARMGGACRSSDLLARIGGDEFALVLPCIGTVTAAVAVAERVRATLAEACMVQDFPSWYRRASVWPSSPTTPPTPSLSYGERTRRCTRPSTAHGACRVRARFGLARIGRIGLLADVAQALATGQFFLEYQPQVNLPTGRIIGVEALVRWRHPVAGVLYPNEFISLAEQTEFIGPLTEWVLRHALAQCASWHREGQDLRVSVNISARNMHDARFPEMLARVVRETGVVPGDIDLEITRAPWTLTTPPCTRC